MPDLLAHALVGFAIGRVLSVRSGRVGRPGVTACMVGACLPDLAKVALLVPSGRVAATLGVPFGWFALHTAGGTLLSALVGGLLVAPRWRRRAVALLAVGGGSHLLLDALLRTPSGRSYPVLWPLIDYHPATPGLYLSTEPWPTVGAVLLAAATWVVTRRATDGG